MKAKEHIDNGNILICEFMGYVVKKGSGGFLIRYDKDGNFAGQFDSGNGNDYHKDWNRLMPVILKMQDISIVNEKMFHSLDGVYNSLLTCDIFNTWKAIVSILQKWNH